MSGRTLLGSIAYALCAHDESDDPDYGNDNIAAWIERQLIADGHVAAPAPGTLPADAEAISFARSVVTDLDADGIEEADIYATETLRHHQYMLAGGGDAAWLHIVELDSGGLDHAYVEANRWGHKAFVPIAPPLAHRLADQIESAL
ncbi:hypothetical protein [Desertimonas flava]|uniref:hypothetical protein n=1 Tax=Desertimonas flava TaxID=2064846 RepID=UPI000E3518D6|nr:hypothetical protein [Desertimonas flava]